MDYRDDTIGSSLGIAKSRLGKFFHGLLLVRGTGDDGERVVPPSGPRSKWCPVSQSFAKRQETKCGGERVIFRGEVTADKW